MRGQQRPTAPDAKEEREPFQFSRELKALNAGWKKEWDGSEFGERQRQVIERAVRTDALAAARTILDTPELVMVGDAWLINVQAMFRLWGKADLTAMSEWVKSHRLVPNLQPAAEYALFQCRSEGSTEKEILLLWRNLAPAAQHWAMRDVASVVASSDPGTALERLAGLFPGPERGEMMSLALDIVAKKHPRSLLPWLGELAPFFYNEPMAADALRLLPADEVEHALEALTEKARAEISLEYMRSCLREGEPERVRKLVSNVAVEPYKSLMAKEWNASLKNAEVRAD